MGCGARPQLSLLHRELGGPPCSRTSLPQTPAEGTRSLGCHKVLETSVPPSALLRPRMDGMLCPAAPLSPASPASPPRLLAWWPCSCCTGQPSLEGARGAGRVCEWGGEARREAGAAPRLQAAPMRPGPDCTWRKLPLPALPPLSPKRL